MDPTTTAAVSDHRSRRVHVLVFPYPAQGHMLPLLDLTHQLALRNVAITVLVTPKNLPILSPLLSRHPSINTLVLPFPASPAIPAGVENAKDLPASGFRVLMVALGGLQGQIVDWFRRHPSPPTAILSDIFVGFTHRLAAEVGVPRYTFSPSGTAAMSVIFTLWREMPKRKNPNDQNEIFRFPEVPNSPEFPWWQLSPVYRSYVEGDPSSEFIRQMYFDNTVSYGLLFNSFSAAEGVYLDYMRKYLGNERIWSVGPLLPPDVPAERGGSAAVSAADILSWLDSAESNSVVYVCFGSQAVLTDPQMEALAAGLEKSGVNFLWSTKGPTKGHVDGERYGTIPPGFQQRVGPRGLVIQGWVPQMLILNHPAVAAFLTHCGWNSTLESLTAGVPLLTWPMGADQYANANLLVDEHRVAVRACQGEKAVPDSDELAGLLSKAVKEKGAEIRANALRLRTAAMAAIKDGGDSFNNLDNFVKHLYEDASEIPKVSSNSPMLSAPVPAFGALV
nr:UDP-glycosyltransferase 89B2-like [Ipomoea batatas]